MRCVLTSFSCVLLLATIISAGCPDGFFTVPGASKCFKSFYGGVSWPAAKKKCLSEGLLLAKPSDNIAITLRNYFLDEAKKRWNTWNEDDTWAHWVDGRGSGGNMVWQRDGTILRSTSRLWRPGQETLVGTKWCLRIYVEEAHSGRPYGVSECTELPYTGGHTLCEDFVPTCGQVNRGRVKRGGVNTATKIVGGVETEVHEYPWQVGLARSISSTRPFCGGSIINKMWILTAAHCAEGKQRINIVVVGEHNWFIQSEATPQKHETATIVIHPKYNASTIYDHDIALIKLAKPLIFDTDNKVAPICPPSLTKSYENVEAIVTGWGKLQEGNEGNTPDALHEVVVPTMPNNECQSDYGGNKKITENMICAGLPEGGKDSCQGDSGGPMITYDEPSYRLIGVVSWGTGCARPGFPGVYARVTNHLDWIRETISGTPWE